MPAVQPSRNDEYFCSAVNVTGEELYITQFDPNADATKIHHIIIYGCGDLYSRSHIYPNSWSCAHSLLCPGMKIIYAWGRNAPSLTLPKGVGFHVGSRSEVRYLVLQAHYATPLKEKDSSGVSLLYTLNPQPNVAGIFLLAASSGIIPPNKPKSHLDVNCVLDRDPIAVFAYRVHAHSLGAVISGYRYDSQERSWTALAKGNPQWPQAFYPRTEGEVVVSRGDLLFARCTFNSTGKDTVTVIGSTAADEMCNLYLMYYSPNNLLRESGSRHSRIGESRVQELCSGVQLASKDYELPLGNDVPLPRNRTLEESARGQNSIHHQHSTTQSGGQHPHPHPHPHKYLPNLNRPMKLRLPEGTNWPMGASTFGQVTAVDVDEADRLVIFHRGRHVWNGRSFSMDDRYRLVDEGPIAEDTIVTIDRSSQKVVETWGSGLFYLPHGLTVDNSKAGEKYLWLTDVALHQVFKYDLSSPGSATYRRPVLTLGERFVPGKDMKHFCKPTSVAVDQGTGDFYVADGYCNSRVMRFNAAGVFQNHWGHPAEYAFGPPPAKPEANMFQIPHKIVIVPPPIQQTSSSSSSASASASAQSESLACVADRENGRIQCFSLPYGYFRFQIRLEEEFNGRLFSVAYSAPDRTLYAVAGPSLMDPSRDVAAFAFNVDTQQLRATFAPPSGSFSQPHDIAVSHSGDAVYVVEIGPNNIWMFLQDTSDDPSAVEEDQEVAKDGTAVQQKQLPSLPVVPESPSSSKSASNFLPSNS
ncbi:PREDICTED: peptidyl-glycine alpha-amidating monooxygenase-like, partial [Rhagoletis zephyria]|uniref:peptidyl-glycine alpha-amidating monooxygenase-like n=1 Tax=Rhagoletis zephyria TaxID=28612 RepID=UPI0008118165